MNILFKRRIILFFVITSIILNGYFVFYNIYSRIENDKSYFSAAKANRAAKIYMFETLPVDTGDILFIGDSITEGFPIAEMSGNCAIKNRGVSGAIADEVLRIILMKNTTKSTKIFLMAGINDLKNSKESDRVSDLIKSYKRILLAKPHNTEMYLQSILPVNSKYFKERTKDMNTDIQKTNAEIRKLANETGVKYVDLYPLFVDAKGNLDSSLSTDGLHLNSKGYRVWYNALNSNAI